MAGVGAARDAGPAAVGDGWVPLDKRGSAGGGVEGEGGLDGEQGSELREVPGGSGGLVEAEDEDEEAKEKAHFAHFWLWALGWRFE